MVEKARDQATYRFLSLTEEVDAWCTVCLSTWRFRFMCILQLLLTTTHDTAIHSSLPPATTTYYYTTGPGD